MNGGDPAFKLFGRKIPVPEPQIHAGDTSSEVTNPETETFHTNKSDEPYNSITVQNDKDDCQTSMKSKVIQINSPKDEQPETNAADQEKVFKKPDKVLPCPRCNSLDTKFCYFNNYNVNQPRHFCKNCHRYWTAGGTMRNVPIGAGRRKNKHLATQYRQIIVSSDGSPMTRIETTDSANQQLLSPGESTKAFRPSMGNGTVLKFGAEAPLCESMEMVLSLGDQTKCVEIQDEPSSCISSSTPCSIQGNALPGHVMKKEQQQNTQHPQQCYPVPPWIFPFNSGPNNVAPMAAGQGFDERISASSSSTSNAVQWCPTPMVAFPGFCQPNIPLQFVPAYWGCMPLWAGGGGGNVSFSVSNGCLSPSSSTSNSCCSGNGSPTLGKHSREANFVEEEPSEKCVLVPKTLRIDDPNEASRSPIWDTLGIKPQQKDPSQGGKIFNAFESKAEGKNHLPDGSHILEANPAALSRSHTFQEST